KLRAGAGKTDKPNFRRDLGLNQDVDLDDKSVEDILVPAARRRLAQQRHQLLSTMVLMGINRIVVTSGRIYAKMGFQIDASDSGSRRVPEACRSSRTDTTTAGSGREGRCRRDPSARLHQERSEGSREEEPLGRPGVQVLQAARELLPEGLPGGAVGGQGQGGC